MDDLGFPFDIGRANHPLEINVGATQSHPPKRADKTPVLDLLKNPALRVCTLAVP